MEVLWNIDIYAYKKTFRILTSCMKKAEYN